LVKVGKRSYAVVVPRGWVDLLGVKPGDPLYVVLNEDGSLTIAPLKVSGGGEVGLEVLEGITTPSTSARALGKLFLALYSAGLRGVKLGEALPGGTPSIPAELATVEQVEGGIVVRFREIRAEPEEVLEDMARRVLEVFNLFYRGLEEPSQEVWDRIHSTEHELDVAVHLATRLTIRKVISETLRRGLDSVAVVDSLLNVLVAKIFEDLSDCIDRSVYRIEELLPLSKDFTDIFSRVRDVGEEIVECYLRRCPAEDSLELLERTTKLRRELKEFMKISTPPLLPLLAELDTAVTLLEDLLEVALIRLYR
jgi:phosphate uptake regulator